MPHLQCTRGGFPPGDAPGQGDYILIGPDHFENTHISRSRDNELWYLSKERGSKPVKLDQKMSEGAAVSKKSSENRVLADCRAGARTLRPEASRLIVADLDFSATPKLMNKKTVYESKDRSCTIEAQDFYDNDSKMTFTCYEPEGLASVMGIDLQTGEVTNFSKAPGTYNEVEGIFPDGTYTCVEADRQVRTTRRKRRIGQHRYLEAEAGRHGKGFRPAHAFQRLRRRQGIESGGLDRRPLHGISERAQTTDPAGVGYGIVLYWFKR